MGDFGQFLPKFGGKWIFLEKRALRVFKYSNYLSWCKKSDKANNPFLIKMPRCWWKDKKTDGEPWFYRTLHKTGVEKIKFGTECGSLWEGKNNSNLNTFIKTIVRRSNIQYSRINQKGNWKKHKQFLLELQKMRPPSSDLHLEGWIRYCRHKYSIKLSLNTKWIQRLLNPTNAFWKDLMLYWLNLIPFGRVGKVF